MGSSRNDDTLPSHSGDESPNFEDLITDGSFQARLAEARLERKRALAEAGIADETDNLLQQRNPWDRLRSAPVSDAGLRRRVSADREPQVSEPLVLPLRVDPPVAPRQMVESPAVRSVQKPTAAAFTSPPPEPAAPSDRKWTPLAVGGGFLAGLAIGTALALIAPASFKSWIMDQHITLFGSPGPVGAVAPVPPVAVPSSGATAAARDEPPKPAIGGGSILLAIKTLSASQPGLLLDRMEPVVQEDPPLHYVSWDAPGPDLGLNDQLAPTPTVPDAEQEAVFRQRILLHFPASIEQGQMDDIMTGLDANGFAMQASRHVGLVVSRNNVRYFHPEDAEAAAVVADAIGAVARDFTSFSPAPPKGTVEVWLAGRGRVAASESGAQRSQPQATRANRDQQVLYLRSLLLQQLNKADNP